MQTRRVKGRKYSDPDLIALIDSNESSLDPYEFVARQAADLLQRFEVFGGEFPTALDRIKALASFAGYQVRPLETIRSSKHDRDGVVVGTRSTKRRGLILYDPTKMEARSVHTIAHEIAHSFFPNTDAGAHFRSAHRVGGAVPELESLCDYGASMLTMPENSFRQVLAGTGITLDAVESLQRQFGTSYEATLYRIATAAPGPVAAGRFCHRSTKAEDFRARQGTLFPPKGGNALVAPKYRRQSFHHSRSYPNELIFPWNKSLPVESVAYEAARTGEAQCATEALQPKTHFSVPFRIEAIPAPYQPDGVDSEWPDVLVLLTLLHSS